MTNISHDDKEPAKKPASDDLIFFRDKSATINGPLDGIEVTTASGLVSQGLTENEEGVKTAFDNQVPQVTPAERTAGTETAVRQFSPSDVSAMALQFGPGGAGSTVLSVAGRTGNVTLSGSDITETTDRNFMTDAEQTKLAGIETGATADQTGAEIKSAYEGEADTNAFTDANQAKLGNLNVSSVAGRTGTVVLSATDITETADRAFLSSNQEAKLSNLDVSSVSGRTGNVTLSATDITENGGLQFITDAEVTKLAGIETGATADQTDAEIETAYNNQVIQVTSGEKTAGTETAVRRFAPQDIHDMIDTHAPAGGGTVDEEAIHDVITGLSLSAVQTNDEFLFRVAAGTDELAITTASGIVDKGLTDLGIDPQNRIAVTRDPNANDDGAATNGVTHIINDLWTNTSTDEAFICLDITTGAAVWSSITATGGGGGAVDSVAGRTGTVVLSATDITENGGLQFITDAEVTKLAGIETNATADQTDAEIETAYNNQVAQVSAGEKTAGTETAVRRFSPADVSSMIFQHAPAGGGTIDEEALHDVISGLDYIASGNPSDRFLFWNVTGTNDLKVTTASGIVNRGLTDLGIEQQERVVTTSDPTANDDGAGTNGINHSISDLWINTDTNKSYICTDNSTNAAIWQQFAASAVTTAERIAATSTELRYFTPSDISAMIFAIAPGVGASGVATVNGDAGPNVILDADDIDDTSTTNKFTTAGDITKLAGIETGATADQTGAEIKTAYEGEANTNAFTDAEKTKLAGIATGAEVNTVDSVNTQTGAVVLDADDISDAATTNKFATATELTKLANLNVSSVAGRTGTVVLSATDITENGGLQFITDAEVTKLAGIETGATADQTGAEIKTAYEGEANTNAFTDAEQTKLAGIETGATADQTDSEIETAYNNQVIQVTSGERTAGTETAVRRFSPADISSMVFQHAPAGGGTVDEEAIHDVITGLSLSAIASNDKFLFQVAAGTDELAVTTASGIVDKGLTDLGIDPQNRIAITRDPNVYDDGDGTNGVVHIINDLWTNTSTDEAFICLDITTSAAVWSSITATGGGGAVDSVAGRTGTVVLSATDITENGGLQFITDAEVTKLAGIETGATADQTGAEIKTAYEAEANTNAFTDAEKTKLAGIATGAEVNTVDSVNTQTGAVVLDADDISDAATTNKFTTAGDITKLAGIETGATADQTGAEIKTAYEAEADTNAFTDAEKTKLAGIATGAEVNETKSELETKLAEFSISGNSEIYHTNAGSAAAPEFSLRRDSASPADGDYLGQIRFDGKNDIGGSQLYAKMSGKTADVTNGTEDGLIETAVVKAGAQTIVARQTGDALKLINGTGLEVDGNITMTTVGATVDGRDLTADGTKLDGIEPNATADQTGAEIKTAYEAEANTNAFTDAEKTKLAGIATGAEVNTVDSVNTQTGAVVLDADDISDAATTNKFTTAGDITKLAGIETGADVTDATNVAAAGAIMDSDISEGEGMLRKTGAGTYAAIKTNFTATAAPGATDDSAAGYSVGSKWHDNSGVVYECTDNTASNAVWTVLSHAALAIDFIVDIGGVTINLGATGSDVLLNGNGCLTRVDMTRYRQARLIVLRGANTRTNLELAVRGRTDALDLTPTNFFAIGESSADVSVVCSNANTAYIGDWTDISDTYKTDVGLGLMQITDPTTTGNSGFLRVTLELR